MPEPAIVERVGRRCSIARSLEVIGEKWSILIVREAFWGRTRFSQFRDALGVSSDILTDRLATLVDGGVLERVPYREAGSRERFSYHLTEAGRELKPVLAALNGWGEANRPSEYGRSAEYRDAVTGEPVELAFHTADGRLVPDDDVTFVRGPAVVAP
ncbi:MAG: helix-turn-helix domain-containing protein [Actinomycetota bacterium]